MHPLGISRGTPVVTLPHVCDGLHVRLMAVVRTFHIPPD
jgi:hypothetical protein